MRKLISFISACFAGLALLVWVGHSRATTVAASTPFIASPFTSTPLQLEKAQKCTQLLKDASNLGLLQSYNSDSSRTTVIVGSAFYTAKHETKQAMNESLRCVLTQGRMDTQTVSVIVYQDAVTHHNVATWTPSTSFQTDRD